MKKFQVSIGLTPRGTLKQGGIPIRRTFKRFPFLIRDPDSGSPIPASGTIISKQLSKILARTRPNAPAYKSAKGENFFYTFLE